ncbi:MAG: hypothetical protein ACRDQ7_15120 [Haloechinothrix sp.]
MDDLHDGYLPADQLRELSDLLRCVATDMTARADELDDCTLDAPPPRVIDAPR